MSWYVIFDHKVLESWWQCNMKIKTSRTIFDFFFPDCVVDSPRMSRIDRSTRSISQPRGKRDSSVSSAYGGILVTFKNIWWQVLFSLIVLENVVVEVFTLVSGGVSHSFSCWVTNERVKLQFQCKLLVTPKNTLAPLVIVSVTL